MVAWQTIRSIVKPISILSKATKKIKSGDYKLKITSKGKDEIADLGNSFNAMAKSLRENTERLLIIDHAIRQSPTSVLVTNLKGNIEFANKSFETTTDYTFKEIEGIKPPFFKIRQNI